MTTPLVPDFILQLFQDEVHKINSVVVQKMCTIYKIDYEDAVAKLADEAAIKLTLSNNQKIKLVKKQKEADPKHRCQARVFRKKDLEVLQCTRKTPAEGACFCKRHQKMHDEGRLKYGTINDVKPDEISTPALVKKKKHTLV
jgi:hypothetical protein